MVLSRYDCEGLGGKYGNSKDISIEKLNPNAWKNSPRYNAMGIDTMRYKQRYQSKWLVSVYRIKDTGKVPGPSI